jgi:hypothetical protein
VHVSRMTAALTIAAAAAAPSAAAAPGAFRGNVCSLATPKQVTAIPGVSSRCTNGKAAPGIGAKSYVGTWAGTKPTLSGLQVSIDAYTDSGMRGRAVSNLNEGLVGSRPKKIAGVGSAAYEATGAGKTEIQFASGKYVARVIVATTGKRSRVALQALAKAIAARLG